MDAFAIANQEYGWLRERGYGDDDEREQIEQVKSELAESAERLYQLTFGRAATADDIRPLVD